MSTLQTSGIDKGSSGRQHSRSYMVIGGLLLCGALGFALVRGSPGRVGPGVTLTFVGFTNRPIAVAPNTNGMPYGTVFLFPQALLLAKNTGSVSVELLSSISQDNFSTKAGITGLKKGFWFVDSVGLPRVLKPGESILLTAFAGEDVSWSTEVQYQRRGLADRFWVRFWESGLPPLRAIAVHCSSSWWRLFSARLGPLTNQPPANEVLAPETNTLFESRVQWLGPPPLTPEVVAPWYSSDLIDTHYSPNWTPEKP